MDLRKHLTRALRGEEFQGKRYLMAVSGGADSMAMLDLFAKVLPSPQLVVAHFDHRTRGKESTADAKFVRGQAKKYGIKFVLGQREEKRLAQVTGRQGNRAHHVSEEVLREARREFLENARVKNRCDFILTAHHLEDQVETFFHRLIRGTGVSGLCGMREKQGAWMKPLLTARRQDLRGYLKRNKLAFREDATNHAACYFRNRIRHEFVPVIQELSKPYGGYDAFCDRFQELQGEMRQLMRRQDLEATAVYRRLAVETSFWIRFGEEDFAGLNEEQKRLFLRRLMQELARQQEDREELDRMLLALSKQQKHAEFPGKISASYSCGQWFFQNSNHRSLEEKSSLGSLGFRFVESDFEGKIELRTPRPGDRFLRKKLKVALLESRIPAPERRILPIAVRKNTQDVMWFLGGPTASHAEYQIDFPFSFSPSKKS